MNQVQLVLNQTFLDLKAKNPRLSRRYFAKKLGLSSGALSEILKGKRKVSPKLAARLAEKLHLDPKATAAMLRPALDFDEAQEIEYLQLQDDQFHLISEWQHFAILNLVKSSTCQHKIAWFAERLNLSERVVQDALNRLLRLGMLAYQKKKYVRVKGDLKTSDNILNLSIQRSNQEDLEMLKEHLATLEVGDRDLTSLTMLLDPARMKEFKSWIRRAQDSFASKFETTESESPYRLTVALFPLKKPKS